MSQSDEPQPFSYTLPDDRIAQRPVYPPEAAKLLAIDRGANSHAHLTFRDLPKSLRPEDHLVFNDTRVFPARIFGTISGTRETPIELLLLRSEAQNRWLCIGRPLRKIKNAGRVVFSAQLAATVVSAPTPDRIVVEFSTDTQQPIRDLLHEHGCMPIPPYIRAGRADQRDLLDYQSIFAEKEGSVAAPTASLHFSADLMQSIERDVGCAVSHVTLHVGAASFLPVLVDGQVRAPESEQFSVSKHTVESLLDTRRRGGRVVAVGTTVVRALESALRSCSGADENDLLQDTQLFIRPGFKFEVVSALITNFHQPGSSHLLLVEAFLGRELLQSSYATALMNEYRFLSYGDGMVIL